MLRYTGVRIVCYFIPALLIAYGDHQIVCDIFSPDKQKKFESICFLVGILSTVIVFPIIIENQKKRIKNQSEAIKEIYNNFRETLNVSLSTYFNKEDLHLNIRIFLRKKGFKYFLLYLLKKEQYFEIHNFEGLYIEKVENLTFQVSPQSQGLVGKCYHDKQLYHDFNLKVNHKNPIYNLKNSQIQRTEYCEFAIAVPMYNTEDYIDAIITFDSPIKIEEPTEEQKKHKNYKPWEEIIKKACKTIYYCKPLVDYKNLNYE